MWTVKTDQMPRLIGVFAGCIDDFVGFVMLRLIFNHQITYLFLWCNYNLKILAIYIISYKNFG